MDEIYAEKLLFQNINLNDLLKFEQIGLASDKRSVAEFLNSQICKPSNRSFFIKLNHDIFINLFH